MNLIDCHRINRYNDISIKKEKVPFSPKQDEALIIELEQRLEVIVAKLNKMIKS